MNKLSEEELSNFIKKNNLCHFKKVNLIGSPNVGKKTLLSYIEHYLDKLNDFDSKEKKESENINEIKNSLLVETIKKLSIPYYENTRKLDINLYISNIDDADLIKENLDILLYCSECIIFMIDISSSQSFLDVSELIPLIVQIMKKNLDYGEIPIFFISNKIDLEQNREVSGFEIKELIDKYENVNNFEISLNLEKNKLDNNINEFIVKLCTTLYETDKKYAFHYDSLNLVRLREPMLLQNESNLFLKTYNTLNFLMLGSQNVGKTSFTQKLFNNVFLENTLATLGIDIMRTIAELYGNLVKIELWDTAGQEKLRSIPKKYYSKADGFFLLFDVCDKKSFEDITGWIKEIRTDRGSEEDNIYKKPKDEVLVLIGNKIDDKRVVTRQEAEELAKKFDIKYCEISCKLGINIYEVFSDIIFEASSINRRESTNFVIARRKTKVQQLNHPEKKKCC